MKIKQQLSPTLNSSRRKQNPIAIRHQMCLLVVQPAVHKRKDCIRNVHK